MIRHTLERLWRELFFLIENDFSQYWQNLWWNFPYKKEKVGEIVQNQ